MKIRRYEVGSKLALLGHSSKGLFGSVVVVAFQIAF